MLISIIFFTGEVTASADTNQLEEKEYCTATLDDDFLDSSVIISLSNEATFKFEDYTPDDFKEINCISVEDLTMYTFATIKQKFEENMLTENDLNFRRILLLEIANPSKENVLSAIKILEIRDDVFCAGPNCIYRINPPINLIIFPLVPEENSENINEEEIIQQIDVIISEEETLLENLSVNLEYVPLLLIILFILVRKFV